MKSKNILIALFFALFIASCKKILDVNLPVNSITTAGVFVDSANANSAILGIYSQLYNYNNSGGSLYLGNGAVSVYTGCSSDEIIPFNTGFPPLLNIYDNALTSANAITSSEFWISTYAVIYQANACIEGLQASKTITTATKNQFTGEATFLRDLCYFYLINLYGDVPYITSATNWAQNEKAARTPVNQIYQYLVADLKNCQSWLKSDYSISNNERTRANQSAANALLSRIYLYTADYKDAVTASSLVIGNSNFSLESGLNNVFSANGNESILQWELNPSRAYPFNVTAEGFNVQPSYPGGPPNFYLSKQLLNAFEPGDNRKPAWVDSAVFLGTTYYYPNKYTLGSGNVAQNATPPQYYTVLRLAEQYLIRAESEANSGSLTAAVSDLNIIRARAGLPALSPTLIQSQVLAAVAQEWRIEFFAEWGHRWFDLKRTQKVDSVMAIVTPAKSGAHAWNTTQKLYPVPITELHEDPNLTQNPGY